MSIFKKEFLKDWLWVATAITAVFGTVVFPGLSDYANHSFWWKFWDIAAVLCGLGVVIGWVYFWFFNKPKDPKDNA